MLEINSRIQIPLEEITFTYARSSGPGGQNVNKVNSKAILRWSPLLSPSLPDAVKSRFLHEYRTRITKENEIVISCQTHRDSHQNRASCLGRLKAMILAVATPPRIRRATRPTTASKVRRLKKKDNRSQLKRSRRPPSLDD